MRHLQSSIRCPAVLFLCVASLVSPASARAQQWIAGRVVEGGSGTPVGGAMVVVLGGQRVVAQGLSGNNGSFRIEVPTPGRFELRVDRIGYASTYSEPFDVAANTTVLRTVESRVEAVTLPGISVEGAGRCEVRPEGAATAVLWEEARKALEAAAWTRERGMYRFAWTRFLREVGADARTVLGEERSVRSELGPQPFVSVAPEVLAREGFVQDLGDSIVYAAPDARVLLSDEFLDTHCFRLDQRTDGGEQLIGLRFEPLRGRGLPDVEGVLWLGRQTLRLRGVEYRYVNLPWDLGRHDAGGEVFFRGLPNGTWIVNEWAIRMLRLSERRSRTGEVLGHSILGYMTEGSVVNLVATTDGEVVDRDSGLGGVRGVVVDSAGRAVTGARVWIRGTDFQVASGDGGRFEFNGVGGGVWSVGASHASLEAVRHEGTFTDADVARGGTADVRIALPSVRAAAFARCEDTPAGEDTRVLVGRVVDAAARPAGGASVRALWSVGRVRQEGLGTDTDAQGRFTLCGVPSTTRVRAWAEQGGQESNVVELAAARSGDVTTVEIELAAVPAASAAAAPGAEADEEEEARWLTTKGFPLRADRALLHQTRRDLAALGSLEKILTQVPRVEAKRLASGRNEYRLRAFESRMPDALESCPLELYLNGSLVRANVPTTLIDYSNPAVTASTDLRPLDLDRWLLPRYVTGVEVFDGEDAPVAVPGGCGAALFWVHRLDNLEDPEMTGSLSGRVVRAADGQPVPGVPVTAQPGGHERRTDAFGRFDFGFLPAARYRVDVAVPEWGSFSSELMLRAGSRAEVAVQVQPGQAPPVSSDATDAVAPTVPPLLQTAASSGAGGDASSALRPWGSGLEVIGTLRDAERGAPVAAAMIELLSDQGLGVVARASSNASGGFRLVAPAAGRYRVRASRLALDTIVHGPIALDERTTVTLDLAMNADPVELPAIDVAVAARVRLLEGEGFYLRQRGGAGVYMSPEDVSRLNVLRTSDLFRAIPGVRFIEQTSGPPVAMTTAGLLHEQRNPPPPNSSPGGGAKDPRTCLPMIYLDGGVVQTGGEDPDGTTHFDLTTIPASQLLAVEVYRGPAETPARFDGPFSTCGVIVIWTTSRLPPPTL